LAAIRSGILNQMVLLADLGPLVADALRLGASDVPDMLELVSLTHPGPFEKRTHEMGEYHGIRVDGKLVAMAGERMRLRGCTEISAVYTHPDHRGHRYAEALVNLVAKGIIAHGETPFIHGLSDNAAAIVLYWKLGYVIRRQFHLVVLARADDRDAPG
jgi:predicted GNAT family acetyltransferase